MTAKNYRIPGFIAVFVFLICMAALFIPEQDRMGHIVLWVSGAYGLICLLFLIFQLYAFVKAHTEYNEDIERPKYEVFELEGVPYSENEDI